MSSAINHRKRSHKSYAKHLSAARAMRYNSPTKHTLTMAPGLLSGITAGLYASMRTLGRLRLRANRGRNGEA